MKIVLMQFHIKLNEIQKKILYETPLFIAVKNEFIDVVKLLLNSDKIDVNLKCYYRISVFYVNDV